MTARLNPALAVQGHPVHLHPFGLAVFHASELRTPVGNAKADMLAIETALDMLLRGY
jgi:hypothetical protein